MKWCPVYVCVSSLRKGDAAIIVSVLGHDVITQQTGKNRKFLTSFSPLPRALPLAYIGRPVHCNSLFLRDAPAQGLGQRTTNAFHGAHALSQGRITSSFYGIERTSWALKSAYVTMQHITVSISKVTILQLPTLQGKIGEASYFLYICRIAFHTNPSDR